MPTKKQSRTADTRESKAQPQPWRPPSMLDAPEAPEGYKFRWIRQMSQNQNDQMNVSKRIREGWQFVKAEDYPGYAANGAGNIAIGDMVLAVMPLETINQRNGYYRQKTNDQLEAVDSNLMRVTDESMPMTRPVRKSQTVFGNKDNVGEE